MPSRSDSDLGRSLSARSLNSTRTSGDLRRGDVRRIRLDFRGEQVIERPGPEHTD